MAWTQYTSGFDSSSVLDVDYGGGQYVAVGLDGKLSTSPNGSVWTARTSNYSGSGVINKVAHGNSIYVAAGMHTSWDDQVITSPDGVTWTLSGGFGDYIVTALCFGDGLFVAGADTGTDNAFIYTSPNGTTWTNVAGPFSNVLFSNAIYAGGLYVLTRNGGVYTSPDGETWTQRTISAGVVFNDVAYGEGLYVAVGGGGALYTSPDCITWTSRTSSFSSTSIFAVTYDGGNFYAAGGNKLAKSTDGISWVQETHGLTSPDFRTLGSNGAGGVVVGGGNGLIAAQAASVPSNGSGALSFLVSSSGAGAEDPFSIGVFESASAASSPGTPLRSLYATVREALLADDIRIVLGRYQRSITEGALGQVFVTGGKLFTSLVTEAVNGSVSQALALGVTAIQSALAVDSEVSLRQLSVSMAEAIVALVSLGQGTSYAILESVSANDQVSPLVARLALLIESAAGSSLPVAGLGLVTVVSESASGASAPVTLAAYLAAVLEGGAASVRLRLGGTEYLGWVLNPKGMHTKDGHMPGVSQYQHFPFNSLARIGSRYFAAGDAGLYELTGTDDAGAPIAGHLKSGKMDFGSSLQKRIDSAWFAVATDGTVRLKVITHDGGENVETWYELTSRDAGAVDENLRLKIGKGLKSRHWQFELVVTEATAFQLDEMQLIPMILTRRS